MDIKRKKKLQTILVNAKQNEFYKNRKEKLSHIKISLKGLKYYSQELKEYEICVIQNLHQIEEKLLEDANN